MTVLLYAAKQEAAEATRPDEYHSLAGKAKDMAAAAVLFTAIFSALIAVLLVWDSIKVS